MKEENNKKIENINENLRLQISQYVDNDSLTIINSNIAVVITSRSEYGSSYGIGYYDQVRVFCGSQSNMREWQWRDRYSASNDEPRLRVEAIGNVMVIEQNGKVFVEVELVNNRYGNRITKFVFDRPKAAVIREFSLEEQNDFSMLLEKEIVRVTSEFDRLWESKPKMVSPHSTSLGDGYVSYKKPSIKQQEIRPEIGVAAFVIEEQIDHRGSDPQIRHELFVITARKKAESLAEDHGYGSEGGAFLVILEINPECIIINTGGGKKTIVL